MALPPRFSIAEDNTVIDGASVIVLLIQAAQYVHLCLQLLLHQTLLLNKTNMDTVYVVYQNSHAFIYSSSFTRRSS